MTMIKLAEEAIKTMTVPTVGTAVVAVVVKMKSMFVVTMILILITKMRIFALEPVKYK